MSNVCTVRHLSLHVSATCTGSRRILLLVVRITGNAKNKLCGLHAGFLNVHPGGTYSNHWA